MKKLLIGLTLGLFLTFGPFPHGESMRGQAEHDICSDYNICYVIKFTRNGCSYMTWALNTKKDWFYLDWLAKYNESCI